MERHFGKIRFTKKQLAEMVLKGKIKTTPFPGLGDSYGLKPDSEPRDKKSDEKNS